MKPMSMTRNKDGTWTARVPVRRGAGPGTTRISFVTFTGTYSECLAWLRDKREQASP
jgi:hypothetical protein